MNILKINNALYCLVCPVRTGTRWINNMLQEANIKEKAVLEHNEPEYREDLTYLMSVRNPFERERSIWRWNRTINRDSVVPGFEEWLLSSNHPCYSEEYPNIFKKVSKFIHIEKFQEFMLDEFSIVTRDYNNVYHKPHDNLTDLEAYSNRDMILKVYEKYKPDYQYLDFIGMDKYVEQI